MFGGDNNRSAIDLTSIASNFQSPPDIIAYSQGTLDTVEAVHNYRMKASSITFDGPAVSIIGAMNATDEAGATSGGYNQHLFDFTNVIAPSLSPVGFISGFVPGINILEHINYKGF